MRRTFADWCRQKADLSPEAKHTVEVLLQYAETTECDAANQTTFESHGTRPRNIKSATSNR
jgi:hypothetical protein